MASESGKTGGWQGNFWLILIIFTIFYWCREAWYSKIRYAVQYGVSYTQVTKPNEPHDCDWLTAPIGNKNCHYDPQVLTVRTATSTTGKPIVSYDDGKTWSDNDSQPPIEPSVFIAWQKIDD
jgi:hypothetical protein